MYNDRGDDDDDDADLDNINNSEIITRSSFIVFFPFLFISLFLYKMFDSN